MATGQLEVRGTVAIAQFWPGGRADADTVNVEIGMASTTFRFRASPGAPFKATRAFDGATVRTQYGKEEVVQKTSASTRLLNVRLEGIDAPELHYRATAARKLTAERKKAMPSFGHEYRQRGAESCALVMKEKLAKGGATTIPCRVVTTVDRPGDVCDMYGRMVGTLFVGAGADELDLNLWLVRQGLALPSFWNSMDEASIKALVKAADEAKKKKRGLFAAGRFTHDAVAFRFGDTYRKGSAVATAWNDDDGESCLPKLYRRKTSWAANKKHGLTKERFDRWLATHADSVHLLDEYLDQGAAAAPLHQLHDFVKASRFTRDPFSLVYREDPSRLIDGNGKSITKW